MLKVAAPASYPRERAYVLAVLLGEFLGLEYTLRAEDRRDWCLSLNGEGVLLVADGLFGTPLASWLTQQSLPKQPLKAWQPPVGSIEPTTVAPKVPVIYGKDPEDPAFFDVSDRRISLGLDIFGSCFFMLTRYEEVVKTERDGHDRVPATASLAYQERFLDRPIVNEYLEVLWACLSRLWPSLERRDRDFQLLPSHDIDMPFAHAFAGPLRLLRSCAGDLLSRRQVGGPARRVKSWRAVKAGDQRADPCNTFDYIMDLSEREGLRSAFYFIAAHTGGALDGDYDLNHPWIRDLLRRVHDRGHEIGLHTSYHTYLDPAQTRLEFEALRRVCESEGIHQNRWGGRQHFLRWAASTTFQNWNDAGLDYDSTLSFADVAGFRCGVCYEFPTFNLVTGTPLRLRERPLVVMECSVTSRRYMGLGLGEEAYREIAKYKERCRLFQGGFTLLWHNSVLVTPAERALYRRVLCS